VERSAVQINITSIRRAANTFDLGSQPLKQRRRKKAGSAVRSIDENSHACQTCRQRSREVFDVFAVQAFVNFQMRRLAAHARFQKSEYVALEHVFVFVRQLESGMIDDLDAVVAIRIVGRRYHDSGRERAGARDVCNAGSGDQSGKARFHSAACETSRDRPGNRRAGFARVHPNDHFRVHRCFAGCRMIPHPVRERDSHGECRSSVQRVLARDAAHSISSKKLSHV